MSNSISKTIVAGVAALAMAAAIVLPTTPADAAFRMGGGGFGGGWHGGGGWGGGWRGGGWGGGWRGGGWGGGWRGGWGGWRGGWGGWGCCGWGWGGWWPAYALGAGLAANAYYPYYGYGYGDGYGNGYGYGGGYGYGNGCWAYHATYSRSGRYLGRRLVNLCQ
jgi:hypothetical protein